MGAGQGCFSRIGRLICGGVALAIGLSSGARAETESGADAVPSGSVFMVEARNSDGTARSGSAVAIGADLFVTSCHVTRHAATIDVLRGPNRSRATVRAGSGELDVCVLETQGIRAPVPSFGRNVSLEVGDTVYAVGFPGGRLSVRRGSIKGLHRYENANVIQVSAAFDFGASGGGLFDRHGNLIGVLTFKILGGDDFHFAVPTDWLVRVLHDSHSARSQFGTDTAAAFWERSSDALPSFFEKVALDLDARRRAGMIGVGTQGRGR